MLLAAHADARLTACPTLDLRVKGVEVLQGAVTTRLGQTPVCAALTSRGLLTYNLANGAIGAVLTLPRTFTLTDNTVRFEFGINGDPYRADQPGRRIGLIWIAD